MTRFTSVSTTSPATAAESGFAILHGSLAPQGCVVRFEGLPAVEYDGPARVFGSVQEALDGIGRGRVRACDIVVIRQDGDDITASGLKSVSAALDDAGIDRVTLLTDASASGNGVIGHIAPGAAARGPIAYVNDDDIIHIDIAGRRIDVRADIDLRRAGKMQKPGKVTFGAGALEKYARLVTSVSRDGHI